MGLYDYTASGNRYDRVPVDSGSTSSRSASCSIADVSKLAYADVAPDAGYDLDEYPRVAAWLDRVRPQPSFMDDLAPYPENARPGRSRSIYDE